MQLSIDFLLVGALLLAVSGVQADVCSTVRQRQEFRSLTHAQRMTYLNALKQLQSVPERPNVYDNYVARHVAVSNTAHGTAQFLSWHRAQLRDLEKNLQAIDPSIMMPYWDWARDSQAPEATLLFDPAYYGGNGNPDNNRCISDGVFADWQPRTADRCVRRNFDNGNRIRAWWSRELLETHVFTHTTYADFCPGIEGPHGNIHNGIGGGFAGMRSPDDPIFWLHHAYVDKLWADWQGIDSTRARSYGGRNFGGGAAQLSDYLDYGYRAADVMNTRELCYTYAPYNGEVNPIDLPGDDDEGNEPGDGDEGNEPGDGDEGNEPGDGDEGNEPGDGDEGNEPGDGDEGNEPGDGDTVPDEDTYVDIDVPGVDVYPVDDNTDYTPDYSDRENIINLRPPVPLPAEWCEMNNINVAAVRAAEAAARDTVDKLNHLPGYISPSALVNRPDALEKLAAEGENFIGYIGDKVVNIPYQGTANVVEVVREKVTKVAEAVYDQVTFSYPKVIKNILKSIDVYNGGKTGLPQGSKDYIDVGNNNNDEECEEYEEEVECDEEEEYIEEECEEYEEEVECDEEEEEYVEEDCEDDYVPVTPPTY